MYVQESLNKRRNAQPSGGARRCAYDLSGMTKVWGCGGKRDMQILSTPYRIHVVGTFPPQRTKHPLHIAVLCLFLLVCLQLCNVVTCNTFFISVEHGPYKRYLSATYQGRYTLGQAACYTKFARTSVSDVPPGEKKASGLPFAARQGTGQKNSRVDSRCPASSPKRTRYNKSMMQRHDTDIYDEVRLSEHRSLPQELDNNTT